MYRKLKKILMMSLVGASLMHNGCIMGEGQLKPYVTKEAQKQVQIKEEKLKEEEKKYFPLTEGNTWTYERTLEDNILSYENGPATKKERRGYSTNFFSLGHKVHVEQYMRKSLPKISEETYMVVGRFFTPQIGKVEWHRILDEVWIVKVEGDSPRDGRYADVDEINKENANTRFVLWGYWKNSLAEIKEGKFFDGIREVLTHTALLTANVKYNDELEVRTILPQDEAKKIIHYKKRVMTSNPHNEVVSVPAGTFDNGLKCTVTVYDEKLENILFEKNGSGSNSSNLEKSLSEHAKYASPEYAPYLFAYITEMYFAKDIGLIKEVRYHFQKIDTNKLKLKETYRLELKSYNVK